MKRIFHYGVFLILLLASSCRTPQNIAYFQGLESLTQAQIETMNQKYVPRICIDDALIINVTSPDRVSAAPFSVPPYGFFMPGEAEIGISATTQNLFTYLVDDNGNINFPVLGRVHVAGMSVNDAIRMMEEMIRKDAPEAVVHIQIANFKVGIIGEVELPEIYHIKSQRISILELIARAGDMTVLADRKNVWLVRDNDGEKVFIHMDMTDPAIFASPYFYLQQNDMVYVLPNDTQRKNSQFSELDNVKISMYTFIVTSISMLITAVLNIRQQILR